MKQTFETPTEEALPGQVTQTQEVSVESAVSPGERISEEIAQARDAIARAEASNDEASVLEQENKLRNLEQNLESTHESRETTDSQEINTDTPVTVEKGNDYEDTILNLRNRITEAEQKNDETSVLQLEDELRGVEVQKKDIEARVNYEIDRDSALARVGEIQKQVQAQTEAVKEVENTNDQEYATRLVVLRGLESHLDKSRGEVTEKFGNTYEEYTTPKIEIAEQEKANEPEPVEQAREVYEDESGSELSPQEEAIYELRMDDKDAHDIQEVTSSKWFQFSPFLFGLFPKNKKKLQTLDRLNIPYKKRGDRQVNTKIASAFRNKSVRDRKKKLINQ